MERPFGVTILAILGVIGGILELSIGAWFTSVALSSETRANWEAAEDVPGMIGVLAAVFFVISIVLIISGPITFVVACGLWFGQGWAWTVSLILTILGLIASIISLIAIVGIVPLIIYIIILYYLTRPHVKAFFGKGRARGACGVRIY